MWGKAAPEGQGEASQAAAVVKEANMCKLCSVKLAPDSYSHESHFCNTPKPILLGSAPAISGMQAESTKAQSGSKILHASLSSYLVLGQHYYFHLVQLPGVCMCPEGSVLEVEGWIKNSPGRINLQVSHANGCPLHQGFEYCVSGCFAEASKRSFYTFTLWQVHLV